MPHTTASALSGSPTLAMKRSSGYARVRASGVPAFISMRIAVGAVYQTLTFSRESSSYQRSGSNSSRSTIIVTPRVRGPIRP